MTYKEFGSSAKLVQDVIDDGNVSGQQLLVVGLCFIFNMVDGFDITAMAVVAGSVARDLDLTDVQLGWIFSFALAGMMAGAMFLAPLADIAGRRKMIVAAVFTVGVSVLLTAQASSLTEFVILRFIAGLGGGAMLACQATLAAEYSPDKYKAFSVAVVTSGYPAGAMLTSVAAGQIMPLYSWTGMFWFGGSVTLAMGIVAWLLIPESLKYLFERSPSNALRRINKILRKLGKCEIESVPIPSDSDSDAGKSGFAGTLAKLVSQQHRAMTLQIWAAFFLSFAALYFLMSWIPKLMENAGFDVADGRQAFFLFNLGAVFGIYLLAFLSTRWRLTNIIAVFASLAALGMTLFANLAGDLDSALMIILLIGVFQQGAFTGLYSVAAKAYPTEVRSTGIGWAIGLGRSGAVFGPAAAGYLIAGGLDMDGIFIVFAIQLALSAIFAWWLRIS